MQYFSFVLIFKINTKLKVCSDTTSSMRPTIATVFKISVYLFNMHMVYCLFTPLEQSLSSIKAEAFVLFLDHLKHLEQCLAIIVAFVVCGCCKNNYHKFGDLNSQKLFLSQFQRPEARNQLLQAETKVLASHTPCRGSKGKSVSLAFPVLDTEVVFLAALGSCPLPSIFKASSIASSLTLLLSYGFLLCNLPLPLSYRDTCDGIWNHSDNSK